MSTPSVVRPPARPGAQPEQRLRVVPPRPPERPRVTFVVFVVAAMATGLVGLLLLNIAMQNAAFELARLEAQAEDLHIRQQALDLEVDRLASPTELAERAGAQGMVPNPNPVFLDVASGEVIGTPTPAAAGSGLTELTPAPKPVRQPQQPQQREQEPATDQHRDDRTAGGDRR